MSVDFDVCVVGAGVIGLAIARELSKSGADVLVLEVESVIGSGTSSRNSEVIHAGVFNPPEFLKSRLCIEGRRKLYAYCEARRVPFRRTGKILLAATPEDEPVLQALFADAEEQRLLPDEALRALSARELKDLEPELKCHAALFSPSTGIVDSHALMQSLLAEATEAGAWIALGTPVERVVPTGAGFAIFGGGRCPARVNARCFINAAGHGAHAIAQAIEGFDAACIPGRKLAKGNYFSLSGRNPFRHPIYPLHAGGAALSQGGYSLHLTIGLDGRAKFGPDMESCDGLDYNVDPNRAALFYTGIRKYWPALPDGALMPDYSGIRPKIIPGDGKPADFMIAGPEQHGIPGLVHLFGIESPGLTSSLAIAECVAAKLEG